MDDTVKEAVTFQLGMDSLDLAAVFGLAACAIELRDDPVYGHAGKEHLARVRQKLVDAGWLSPQ